MSSAPDVKDSFRQIVEDLWGWVEGLIVKLPSILLAVLAFIFFWFLGKYIGKLLRNVVLKKAAQESVKIIIGRSVFILFIAIGFFTALGILNLDKMLTSVLAGAGIAGLAIGLALQGTLSNTVSGVILSFLPKVRIGDWVETNGYYGQITDINLRNVTLMEVDNNLVFIPNSKIIDEPLKNYSNTSLSRVTLYCGVGYESDLEFVRQTTIKAVQKEFNIDNENNIRFIYTEFGDFSIDFFVRYWVSATNRSEMREAVSRGILAIKKAYNENNINIPFPIRTLDFGKNKFRSETITIKNDS